MTRGMPIPETVTLHIPFRVVKRGGRKEMQLPKGAEQPGKTDNTMVKALARAFRWRRMLESGDYGSIADLARAEKIGRAYVSAMLRLALPPLDIVEAILQGRQGGGRHPGALMAGVPVVWRAQLAWRHPGPYTASTGSCWSWSALLRVDRSGRSELTEAGLSKEESPCPDAIAATAPNTSARSSPSATPARPSTLFPATMTCRGT